MNLSFILSVFAVLVTVTNLLVNVIRGVITVNNPRRIVLIVAVLLTAIVLIGYGVYSQIYLWYQWAGVVLAALLGGGLVAYVAMYGYDEGYDDLVLLIQRLVGYLNGGNKND